MCSIYAPDGRIYIYRDDLNVGSINRDVVRLNLNCLHFWRIRGKSRVNSIFRIFQLDETPRSRRDCPFGA